MQWDRKDCTLGWSTIWNPAAKIAHLDGAPFGILLCFFCECFSAIILKQHLLFHFIRPAAFYYSTTPSRCKALAGAMNTYFGHLTAAVNPVGAGAIKGRKRTDARRQSFRETEKDVGCSGNDNIFSHSRSALFSFQFFSIVSVVSNLRTHTCSIKYS